MKIVLGFKEIAILTVLFTALALYYDIYRNEYVLPFVIHHVIALLISLGLAKLINTIYLRFR